MATDQILKRKNAELSALFEVSKALNASFDMKKNITQSMKVLSDYLDMTRATVALVDFETKELHIIAAHGLSPDEIARGKYRIGEGIVGRVVKSGYPMVIPNIGEEPLFLDRTRSRIDKNNIAFLCVPIKFKGETLGVLSSDRVFDERISFEEDLRLLKIVASLIAQNVKLYQAYLHEKNEREKLTVELKGRYSIPNVIGASDKMQDIFRTVQKVTGTKAAVLLRGESGTGKEMIAKALHYGSPQSKGPFITVNCAALPENLLESELFGYEKGAFTGAVASKKGRFELADNGTIFLDEIGDVKLLLQAKLLRVLQEHSFERLGSTKTIRVDIRIIAATNRNLEDMVKEGSFREDLYWRLNVVPIFLPNLSERKEDIPLFIDSFLKRFNTQYKKNVCFSNEAIKKLLAYSWPGNVRELENITERLVVLAEKDLIPAADLPAYISSADSTVVMKGSLTETVEDIERKRIIEGLKECGLNQAKAAKLLGLTPRQIGYKIKKYNITTKGIY